MPCWPYEAHYNHAHLHSGRHLTLDNELQVLLVSDPVTEKAAASLAVRVGETTEREREWEGGRGEWSAHTYIHHLFPRLPV